MRSFIVLVITEPMRMHYVRMVEERKRVAVEAVTLTSGKVGHILVTSAKQPPVPAAVSA
jgi:hypothetical protein